ncbi:MAG: helix-turn-helix transcriptional regulator [Lachnospiraceae bacterium]|nr:helix-turn-helix transcriptional regulator [Lachnospiraceae bacterium]
MERNLAENIRNARKSIGLTQEQLAEKLGITLGTISKWERGASEPEISYLMELADIFRISVDALIGFSMRGGDADTEAERIEKLLDESPVEEVIAEYDKALRRFPNNFRIVCGAADCYERLGTVYNKTEAVTEAIKLYRHSIELISQNKDPRINEVLIRNSIAQCYSHLKDYRRAIEEYKANNTCGMNDANIGLLLIRNNREKEGVEYVQRAYIDNLIDMTIILSGYLYYYVHVRKPEVGVRATEWAIDFMKLLKKDDAQRTYLDKPIACWQFVKAAVLNQAGRDAEADECLREAVRIAKEFDEEPIYTLENIMFTEHLGKTSVYDDAGPTAMDGLRTVYAELREYIGKEFQEKVDAMLA